MQSTQYCTELSLYNDPETNDSNIHTYSHVVTNGILLCFQIAVFGLRYFASPLLLPNQHFPMHTGNIPWSNVLVYTNDANWKLLGYSFFLLCIKSCQCHTRLFFGFPIIKMSVMQDNAANTLFTWRSSQSQKNHLQTKALSTRKQAQCYSGSVRDNWIVNLVLYYF